MKKFNGFEAYMLEMGLKMYVSDMVNDIIAAESDGRRPLMTVDYVRSIEAETLAKLKSLTIKQK